MPRVSYPRPWTATGHGSYRELSLGYFEMRFRDEHGEHTQRVPCNAVEAAAFLERKTRNRRRILAGMPAASTWDDAIKMYSERMTARGNGSDYVDEVVSLLNSIRDSADVEPPDVQPIHIDNWLQKLATSAQASTDARPAGFPGWARTANKKRGMVAGFFNWLYRRRLIAQHPVVPVEEFRQVKKVVRNLTAEEYAKVWQACESELRDLLDFLLLTGCRIGEAAAMKRSDMSADGVWTIKNRKGKNDLVLDLPGLILEIVVRQPVSVDGLVWHRWNAPQAGNARSRGFASGEAIDEFWFKKVIAQRCKIAGVKAFTAHPLRHAAGSWLAENNVSAKTIQSLLGHTRLSTTEQYMHGNMSKIVRSAQQTLIDIRTAACTAAVNVRENEAGQGEAKSS